jgi:hypothetical protein
MPDPGMAVHDDVAAGVERAAHLARRRPIALRARLVTRLIASR